MLLLTIPLLLPNVVPCLLIFVIWSRALRKQIIHKNKKILSSLLIVWIFEKLCILITKEIFMSCYLICYCLSIYLSIYHNMFILIFFSSHHINLYLFHSISIYLSIYLSIYPVMFISIHVINEKVFISLSLFISHQYLSINLSQYVYTDLIHFISHQSLIISFNIYLSIYLSDWYKFS